jgi:hypothetical protein
MSESLLQEAVVALLRFNAAPDVIWYAVPNGEYRSKRTGARLKKQGVVAGVADLAIVAPDGQAAFLELKTPSGRLSPQQKAFRSLCEANGAPYAVATTLDEARHVLAGWGALAHWSHGPGAAAYGEVPFR